VCESEWATLADQVKHESAAARWVSFSGSLPPESRTESFANIVRDLIVLGKEVWVDTSGSALESVLAVQGVNLKINGDEAGLAVSGEAAQTVDQAVAVARRLRRQGVGQVVITLGSLGAVMSSGSELLHAQPPSLKIVSAVGSGDAFLGGLLQATSQNRSARESLGWGVAAGAANALSVSGGQIALTDFNHLLSKVSYSNLG
jgi:fructose-1-phosphate kinase PfkB-like protein